MALFGGSKTTQTTTNLQEETNRTYADYSTVDGDQNKYNMDIGISESAGAKINFLDGGAIKNAFEFSGNTVDGAFGFASDTAAANKAAQEALLREIGNAGQRETATAMAALQASKPSDVQTSGDLIKYGAFAVIAIAAVFVLTRGN